MCKGVKVLRPRSNLAFETPLTKAYIYASMDMARHPDNWICSSSGLSAIIIKWPVQLWDWKEKEITSRRGHLTFIAGACGFSAPDWGEFRTERCSKFPRNKSQPRALGVSIASQFWNKAANRSSSSFVQIGWHCLTPFDWPHEWRSKKAEKGRKL